MSLIAITRFEATTDDAADIRTRHNDLVDAVRATIPGLTEARLGRLEDQWVGVWRWESADDLKAARELAPTLAETKAAFALVREGTSAVDEIEVVDER
ncbi:antibiotic biosynthesis monooxygenase [Kribbella sp. NPDC026596]|uniref:antibiotic biosynthesis monooxygenase n=1 Tax=Kribbella sp. NPDC026596 TaxID=3155122 RepID=UPI0033D67C80